MNTGVIDKFLSTFITYIDSGFGLLGGEVAFLATTLFVIDLTIAALFWALAPGEDIVVRLIKKTLYVGFFLLLIGSNTFRTGNNFNVLSKIVFDSFSGLGLKAAGSTLTADDFLHPGKIAQAGLDASRPILQAAGGVFRLPSITSLVENGILGNAAAAGVDLIALIVAWFLVLGSFFILAIQLFVTLVEFKLTTLAGFVLVPFGLFGKTAFLAERVLGNVIASGVKILVLAVVVGIGTGLFGEFTKGFGSGPLGVDDALAMALAALTLLGLGIYAPGIATGLAAGAPQLGAGAAVGTAFTVAGAAIAGGAAVQTAGSLLGPVGTGLAANLAANRSARWTATTGGGPSGAGPSPSGPSGGGSSAPPWARRMKRQQAMSQGLGAVGRALQSGDRGGASTSINLRGES
jgi:type IV secretion system protein TrbL